MQATAWLYRLQAQATPPAAGPAAPPEPHLSHLSHAPATRNSASGHPLNINQLQHCSIRGSNVQTAVAPLVPPIGAPGYPVPGPELGDRRVRQSV